MKKIFFFYFSTFILSLFLQLTCRNFFAEFTPNFLLLIVINISLLRGALIGEFFGFTLGLFSDTFSLTPFGAQAFLYTLIGYFIGRQKDKIDTENTMAQIILVIVSTLFYLFGLYLLVIFFSSADKKLNIFPQFFLNIGFTLPFFWLFKKWFGLWKEN